MAVWSKSTEPMTVRIGVFITLVLSKVPKTCFKNDYIAVFLGKIEESYGGGYFKLREILTVAVHIGDGFHTLRHFRKGRFWDINAVYFYPVGIAYYIRRGERPVFSPAH